MGHMPPFSAADNRYMSMPYRRCGRSGLKLPAISLGLWQNFGDINPLDTQRAMLRWAFDRGVTHFDLANNYGPPFGSAETNFGRVLKEDFRPYRDELIISTKAGWDMWPGPYGGMNGSKKYMIASFDQSLKRMGLDYVDIYYSHRPDPHTPLEETMGALALLYKQGKALYVGISNYNAELTKQAAAILKSEGVPLTISQPNYSLLDRWIEPDLLATNAELASGPGVPQHQVPEGRAGRFARGAARLGAQRSDRSDDRPYQGAERPGAGARPEPGADGPSLDAARRTRHLDADRCAHG